MNILPHAPSEADLRGVGQGPNVALHERVATLSVRRGESIKQAREGQGAVSR